ncbi:MAG: hypothetical protein ACTSUE_07665 [Promethearchaeota archaeon]
MNSQRIMMSQVLTLDWSPLTINTDEYDAEQQLFLGSQYLSDWLTQDHVKQERKPGRDGYTRKLQHVRFHIEGSILESKKILKTVAHSNRRGYDTDLLLMPKLVAKVLPNAKSASITTATESSLHIVFTITHPDSTDSIQKKIPLESVRIHPTGFTIMLINQGDLVELSLFPDKFKTSWVNVTIYDSTTS